MIKSEIDETLKLLKDLDDMDTLDTSADYIAELLIDDSNSTYKMFEELASEYQNGNDDYRNGIDMACIALTGYSLKSIAAELKDRLNEKEHDME